MEVRVFERLPKWALYGAAVLAFSAGCVNSTTLVGFTHLSASHVTGNVTLFANAIVTGDWAFLGFVCLTLLAFLMGSVMSGYVVGGRSFRVGRRYEVALVIEGLLLTLAFLLLYRGLFWGQLFAAMACGLQNAMVATYSGAIIRTTHLTGLTSDMGSAIGNFLAGRPIKKSVLLFQVVLWYAFCLGCVVGAVLFVKVGYLGLMLPIFVIAILVMLYQMGLRKLSKKYTRLKHNGRDI